MDIEINDLTSLVEAVKNGEDGAFEKLYHKSFKHAYSTASLLLKKRRGLRHIFLIYSPFHTFVKHDLSMIVSFANRLRKSKHIQQN